MACSAGTVVEVGREKAAPQIGMWVKMAEGYKGHGVESIVNIIF